MFDRAVFRDVLLQQKDNLVFGGTVKREILGELLAFMSDSRVMILTGLRRSGKSTILRQIMAETAGYCYVNFDDERFLDFKAEDFERLNELLAEVYGNSEVYFFDEVQNVYRFESFVRRLQDQGKKIILTGSNASLLSREFGTRLTGRYRPFEVYPFSFKEYLEYVGAAVGPLQRPQEKAKASRLFGDYLFCGGIPEYLKNADDEYIRTLYENILYRDIVTRYSIKKHRALKELVNVLASNISSTFTYNSLKKTLGLSNSITVKEYIGYLNNSYLFFELQKYDDSPKAQLTSPKKAYVVDNSFNKVLGLNAAESRGRLLENAVFIELKRRGKQVYYFSKKNECDFVIKDGRTVTSLIQVCYDLNDGNYDRETAGLAEAMKQFNLESGTILTFGQSDEMAVEGKKVTVKPVWMWLLEGNKTDH